MPNLIDPIVEVGDIQVDGIWNASGNDPEAPAQWRAEGEVAQTLLNQGLMRGQLNVNCWRPWFGEDGRSYISVPKRVENGVVKEWGKLSVNQALARGLHVNATTLRKDEWKQYDTAVIEAARQRLTGIQDLISRGLTYNIPNGLGTTVLEWEDVSDLNDPVMNMAAEVEGQGDRVVFGINYLPLPIISKTFKINARVLAASRTTGQPLDTTQAALCGKKVAEYAETILFQGSSSYTFGGGTIYGYEDALNRNTVSLSTAWDNSAMTGALILEDLKDMIQASVNARHYGPWVLYVPTAYQTKLEEDYNSNYPKSIRKRLMEFSGLEAIKVADFLTADNVILAQMTSDVVRMVQGLPITTVQWETQGNMIYHYKIMTILVPNMRSDQNSRSGLVHLS